MRILQCLDSIFQIGFLAAQRRLTADGFLQLRAYLGKLCLLCGKIRFQIRDGFAQCVCVQHLQIADVFFLLRLQRRLFVQDALRILQLLRQRVRGRAAQLIKLIRKRVALRLQRRERIGSLPKLRLFILGHVYGAFQLRKRLPRALQLRA